MPENHGSLPYGPFTAQARRFLQHLAALTRASEEAVVAEFRQSAMTAEFRAAERVLGAAIARSGRESERDALGGPLLQLVQVDRSSSRGSDSAETPQTPSDNPTPLRPIAEPALAALLAVVMQDVLSSELVAQLYSPFDSAIPRASLHQ